MKSNILFIIYLIVLALLFYISPLIPAVIRIINPFIPFLTIVGFVIGTKFLVNSKGKKGWWTITISTYLVVFYFYFEKIINS